MNLYLYFSGTGNTKFAVETFANLYEQHPIIHSIEETIDFGSKIKKADMILIGYPIYGSDLPKIMKEFINHYLSDFQNKSIMTLATQMLFSGDGGALPCYMLKKASVNCTASMHINMPENITDVKIFKHRTADESKHIYQRAEQKINDYVLRLKQGKKVKTGRRFYSRLLGFLMQRSHFKLFFKHMQKSWKVNHETCIHCQSCIDQCPVNNLISENGQIKSLNQCILCYRCVNICPSQSIKILGKNYPKKQYVKK